MIVTDGPSKSRIVSHTQISDLKDSQKILGAAEKNFNTVPTKIFRYRPPL
jgi:hypothetical protein